MASPNQLDISVETAKGLERRITVRVPNTEIEREIDQRLKKMGKTVRMKGFRPGKVPPKVVRKRYGGQVRQEVVGDIIRKSFSHAVTQKQLNPAGGPAIEPLASPDDTHFAYRAVFEVYPEIELNDLSALKFERPEVKIEESDVDKMIQRLRKQKGSWEETDKAAAKDDRITVDFSGTIGKEPFDGGEGKDIKIVLGSGQVIEDFEKALIGHKGGDEFEAKVKFPKDYGVDALAGKKAVFAITVHRVESLVLPEVDDEFIAAFGIEDGGIDAFRADVRKNMQRELDERLRATVKNNALDALHDAHPVELPKALVDDEVRALQADAMRRMGIDDPAQAPAAEHFKPMAEKRVRLSLLVQDLIVKEKIELDRNRVDARIDELASPYEEPAEAAKLYRSNRELMTQIESSVLEDQVVDRVVDKAGVKAKTYKFDEFMKMQDAD